MYNRIKENADAVDLSSPDGDKMEWAKINNTTAITLKLFRNKLYVSLKQSSGVKDRFLNITKEDFDRLIEIWKRNSAPKRKHDAIKDDANKLDGNKSGNQTGIQKKKKMMDSVSPLVTYKWVTNTLESTRIFYRDEDALMNYVTEHPDESLNDAVVSVEESTTTFPSMTKWSTYIRYYLVMRAVERRAIETCLACSIDSPSQKDHVQGGCMKELDEKVAEHLDAIGLTPGDIVNFFEKCMNFLNRNERMDESDVDLTDIVADKISYYIPFITLFNDVSYHNNN